VLHSAASVVSGVSGGVPGAWEGGADMRAILPLLSFQAQATESDKYHFKQNIDIESRSPPQPRP
jgi:hypothetical protein